MKRSLLDMVQGILSKIDGDEVNHISDTTEAEQIASLIQDCFFDIVEEFDLPYNGNLITLDSFSTVNFPTRLRLPENVSRIDWINYKQLDIEPVEEEGEPTGIYHRVCYRTPERFVNMTNSRSTTDANIQLIEYPDDTTIILAIRNDQFPSAWTSFDDEFIWFDSWDSDFESTINANNTQVFGYTSPSFTVEDTFIPDLPANLFPYLYAMAEAQAFSFWKQAPNPKSEQKERRLRVRSQRNRWRQGRMLHDQQDYSKPSRSSIYNRPILRVR